MAYLRQNRISNSSFLLQLYSVSPCVLRDTQRNCQFYMPTPYMIQPPRPGTSHQLEALQLYSFKYYALFRNSRGEEIWGVGNENRHILQIFPPNFSHKNLKHSYFPHPLSFPQHSLVKPNRAFVHQQCSIQLSQQLSLKRTLVTKNTHLNICSQQNTD